MINLNLNKYQHLRNSTEDILKDTFIQKYLPQEKMTIIERINKKLIKIRTIQKICKKLKIEPIYLLLIFLTPVIILLFTFFTFTTTMISTLYPLYMSFKTLKYQVNKWKNI